jgi:hypothetical protein
MATSSSPLSIAASRTLQAVRAAGGGGAYTITGSGFGTKATNSQFFEDFESEPVGQITTFQSDLNSNGASQYISISNSVFYSGSRALAHDFSAQSFPKIYKPLTGTRSRAYLSCYFRFDGDVDPAAGVVWKLGRIGANSVYGGVPRASAEYTSPFGQDMPQDVTGSITAATGFTYSIHNQATASPASTITNGAWHFYEVEFYAGTLNNSDAFFKERFNGIETITYVNRPFLETGGNLLPTWFLTPINGLDGTPALISYMDNLLIDESNARVVMTDSAVYANSTKFAVQPITSYSNTAVEVAGKRQGFSAGVTAYLHLFDDTGTLVSQGNAITVVGDAA